MIKKTLILFFTLLLIFSFNLNIFADNNGLDFKFNLGEKDDAKVSITERQGESEEYKDVKIHDKANKIYTTLQNFCVGFGGLVFIILFGILIKVILNIAIDATNSNRRADLISSMIRIFIGLGLTGSITTVLYFSFNFLKNK